MSVTIFCWNVQGRVGGTLRRQVDAVVQRKPAIVALQELTTASLPEWERGLGEAGYSVISTVDLVARPYPAPPYPTPPFPPPRKGSVHGHVQRRNFNLSAARHPIKALPGLRFDDPDEALYGFPEKYLATEVEVDGAEVHVHNAHVPHGSGRGVIKVHAFEAIRRRVDADAGRPTVLCGDFNAPWSEDARGPRTGLRRKWPDDVRTRWLEAEAALLSNPRMRDVYRDVHDAEKPFPVSHFTGRKEHLTGHRYDYIFATPELKTESCEYLSDWLDWDESRWRRSDHAPVAAELSLCV